MTPSGGMGGGGFSFPPDATLIGRVIGLDKYVTPTPGSCDMAPATGSSDCSVCDPDVGCVTDGFGCVDLFEQGHRCLAACELPTDCAAGFVCAGLDDVARCMPDPGERIARCGVSAKTVFSTDVYTPPTGWVGVGEHFQIQSTRLGDLAIVCWGGYRTPQGIFTPTAMGVRRHVHALSAQVLEDLDVELSHPLREIFRLRLMSPPTWTGGLNTPAVTISIDLGSDGAIPMTRSLVEGEDGLLLAPHQVSALDGDLYDGTYSFYSSVSADSATGYPVGYNFVQLVSSVVEPRLPILVDGEWTLESTELRQDLFGLWGDAEDALFAVGADGLILRFNGIGWYAQTSKTPETLRAVHGRASDDVWAVGDAGALTRWDGLSWELVQGPLTDLRAVATAAGQPVWVAGDVRVHRYDDASGEWSVEGPPWVQGVRGLALRVDDGATDEGQLAAAAAAGRVVVRDGAGAWHLHQAPESEAGAAHGAMNDVAWLDADSWIAVGERGLVMMGGIEAASAPTVVNVGSDETFTAVTVTDAGRVHIVGDNGVAIAGQDGVWVVEEIPDYRARAEAVFAPPGSDRVRVVGGVAFVLGPFLAYPVSGGVDAHGGGGGFSLPWTWDGGVAAQYTRLVVSPEYAPSIWTLIVDGDEEAATLPDLAFLAGLEGVGSGARRLELMRVLNLNFDIDAYSSRQFSIYRRSSWSVNQSVFYAP